MTLAELMIQMYDSGLRKFLGSLEEVHPSLDASVRTPYGPSPSHRVVLELDELNVRYLELFAAATKKTRNLLDGLQQRDPVAAAAAMVLYCLYSDTMNMSEFHFTADLSPII